MDDVATLIGPHLLKNFKLLKEIQTLRVIAWDTATNFTEEEKLISPTIFNDNLDLSSYHWYYTFENKIIASARLSRIFNIKSVPYPKIFNSFTLPEERPFYLLSRLVVHPDFRENGLAKKLDLVRLSFINNNPEKWAMGTSKERRKVTLEKYGFTSLGIIPYDKEQYPFSHTYFMIKIFGG